nr:DUF3169 family protein [Konateibacter massiliensis]
MKSENVKQIKAEDKKVFRKFVVILILSMLAGGVIGVAINLLGEGAADAIANAIIGFLAVISPAANFVLTVAILIPVVLLYKKCRELYKGWDGEKEEDLNQIEVYLSYALWLSSFLISIPFFFLAAGAYTISFKEMSGIGFLAGLSVLLLPRQSVLLHSRKLLILQRR